jgi:hypothetical protein
MRYEKCMPMLTNTTNGLQESTMAGESRAMKSIYPIGHQIEVPQGPPVPGHLRQEAAVMAAKAEPLLPAVGVEAKAEAGDLEEEIEIMAVGDVIMEAETTAVAVVVDTVVGGVITGDETMAAVETVAVGVITAALAITDNGKSCLVV